MHKPDSEYFDINLVRQGPLFRYQRQFRLIKSDQELSIGRRIGIAILVTWAPIMLLALLHGELFGSADPLLRHFGVHSRCLIAIPLLIVAEGLAQTFVSMVVDEFVKSGLVGENQIPAFREAIEAAKSLLNSTNAFRGFVCLMYENNPAMGYLWNRLTPFVPVIQANFEK